MTFKRPCLLCDDPALGVSLYCEPCRESAKTAYTEDPLVNRRIDQDRNTFRAPSRGWATRVRRDFLSTVDYDANDLDQGAWDDDAMYEDEVGWFEVHMRHDPYVDSYGVTLEKLRSAGIIE